MVVFIFLIFVVSEQHPTDTDFRERFDYNGAKLLESSSTKAIAIKSLVLINESDEFSQDSIILPPLGYASTLFYTGIGTPITYKRFYEPAEDFFAKLWMFCDPNFILPDIIELEDMLRLYSEDRISIETIDDCFHSIEPNNLKIVADRLGATYALVPKSNFAHLENHLNEIYPIPFMLIKIDDL